MHQFWWHKLCCTWLQPRHAGRDRELVLPPGRSRKERSDAWGKIWWKRKRRGWRQIENRIFIVFVFVFVSLLRAPCCFPKLISQWGLGSVPNGSTLWVCMHRLVCVRIFSCVLLTHMRSKVHILSSESWSWYFGVFNGWFKSFFQLELLKQ